MGKKVCLIDYENTALPGLDGLENLSAGDCLRIICSNESIGNTLLHILSIYRERKITVEVEYMSQRGSNALDFRISCDLGYFIAQGDVSQIYVVSKDRGYLHAISEASALNSDVLIVCGVSIRDCLFKVEHGMTELPIDDYIKPCKEAKEADAALRLEWQKASAGVDGNKTVKALDIIKKKMPVVGKKKNGKESTPEKSDESKTKPSQQAAEHKPKKKQKQAVQQINPVEKNSDIKDVQPQKRSVSKEKKVLGKGESSQKEKKPEKEAVNKSKQPKKKTESQKKQVEKRTENQTKRPKKKNDSQTEQLDKKNMARHMGNNKSKSLNAKNQEELENMTNTQKKNLQQEIRNYLEKHTSIEENYISHLAALIVKEHSVMDFRRAAKTALGKKYAPYEAEAVSVYMYYRR